MSGPADRITNRLAQACTGARLRVEHAPPALADRYAAQWRGAAATIDRWLTDESTTDVGEQECIALAESVGS